MLFNSNVREDEASDSRVLNRVMFIQVYFYLIGDNQKKILVYHSILILKFI